MRNEDEATTIAIMQNDNGVCSNYFRLLRDPIRRLKPN